MAISKEEQEYLVEQLESLTSKRPLFYLKFCSQENMLKIYAMGNYMLIQQNILERESLKRESEVKEINLNYCYQ